MEEVPEEKISGILARGEINRIIRAFLTSPERIEQGASQEEILKVVRWAEELKLKAAINLSILKEIYVGALYLDLNKEEDVVMGLHEKDTEYSASDAEIEEWLSLL